MLIFSMLSSISLKLQLRLREIQLVVLESRSKVFDKHDLDLLVALTKFSGSTKSLGLILRGPLTSIPNCITIHQMLMEVFHYKTVF